MRMVRHPLDAGIGEDHVEVGRQLVQPRGHVAQLEIDVGIGFARCLDHDRRAVDAENLLEEAFQKYVEGGIQV